MADLPKLVMFKNDAVYIGVVKSHTAIEAQNYYA